MRITPAVFEPRYRRPLRRALTFLALAAGAHALLGVVALATLAQGGGAHHALAPLALGAAIVPASLLAALAGAAFALAAFTLVAARRLARLAPGSRAVSTVAAWLALLNVPLGMLFGLLALGQLHATRVVLLLRESVDARTARAPRRATVRSR